MLPRRHILDVWEMEKDREKLLSMAALTLAIDATKYLHTNERKDHLVEALELNEFICFMYPRKRPGNKALLFHVVSDLLGLLMYGFPKTRKRAIDNIESVNYSEKSVEVYPVIDVWNDLKGKVYEKKHGADSIINGFIRKIRVEMEVVENYRFVDDILCRSSQQVREWLPCLADYYCLKSKTIEQMYDKWWASWCCNQSGDAILAKMIDRLFTQVEREFGIRIDRDSVFSAVRSDKTVNKTENDEFARWYRQGVNLLLKI